MTSGWRGAWVLVMIVAGCARQPLHQLRDDDQRSEPVAEESARLPAPEPTVDEGSVALSLLQAQTLQMSEAIASAASSHVASHAVTPLSAGHRPVKTPVVRRRTTTVCCRLPPEVIQRVARSNFGRARQCYERALRANPKLAGKVIVSFVIMKDGSVSGARAAGGDLPDETVKSCVASAFNGLSFPAPEGGNVIVTYPISFSPPPS